MRANFDASFNLRKKEYSFILNMARQCEGNGGSQMPIGDVLRALIRLLQHLDVNVSGVKTEDQLLQRLKDAI